MAIPSMRVGLIAPEPYLQDRAFIRIHNRAAKDALEEVAKHHHKVRIPQHFTLGASEKYGYAERKPKYKKYKLRRWNEPRDLVSGDNRNPKTKDYMARQTPRIRLGGKAANPDGTAGQLRLTMGLSFPFPLSRDVTAAGVSGQQMKREIAAITANEAKEIAEMFKQRYLFHLKKQLANRPRIRKRLTEAGINLEG